MSWDVIDRNLHVIFLDQKTGVAEECVEEVRGAAFKKKGFYRFVVKKDVYILVFLNVAHVTHVNEDMIFVFFDFTLYGFV